MPERRDPCCDVRRVGPAEQSGFGWLERQEMGEAGKVSRADLGGSWVLG